MTPTRTILTLIFTAIALSSCATERYNAIERRQDGIDARHGARVDRRELRSERADARALDRW